MTNASKELMLGKRNQITLPKEYVPSGAHLFLCEQREDGAIVLIPEVSIPANQAFFWTKRWQRGERQASEEIRVGRVRAHRSADELMKHLEQARRK